MASTLYHLVTVSKSDTLYSKTAAFEKATLKYHSLDRYVAFIVCRSKIKRSKNLTDQDVADLRQADSVEF